MLENESNVTSFVLVNEEGSCCFEVQVHNDGVAYRYTDVTAGTGDTVTVLDERSEIALPKDCTSWAFGLNGTYEGIYEKSDGVYEIIE